MILPVILSGGAGTRLWPLSRELYPKQLLPLTGDETMIQQTAARAAAVAGAGAPIVVCNETHRFLVAEQLREAHQVPAAIILEPVGRNTAPAVAVAALVALEQADDDAADPILLVMPADHLIRDQAGFESAVAAGQRLAAQDYLVTFGISPDRPETGYGYIRQSETLLDEASAATGVAEFVEKPDIKTARQYIDSGNYLWNSGIFMFRAGRYLEELGWLAPAIKEACEAAVLGAKEDLDFLRLDQESFEDCPSDSIDYAVMEKTRAAAVVPLAADWSDVGSWAALHRVAESDAADNVTAGDVITEDTEGCFIYSSGRLVATVGLRGHIVVETADAVMVAAKNRVEDVKKLVQQLKEQGREEPNLHRKVYRPWGSYDSIEVDEGFQVKRITVNPGGVLSLQLHHRRAEHWVVVRGTAKVRRGDETFMLKENESTYIPVETMHRLENPGSEPVELIEVQTGDYLGEDDIERFEDQYGREGTNK
ncbi:MAG: mannose-1-phosphate guanylyltransferase/mannose-6-phosphate isomerase [Gammaproteobacteria bacterium]|nr:mannose-1-phosphate guanylyltransferase/mannose-6-phosphate isomerase [Gammaproteobacteria bacterium]